MSVTLFLAGDVMTGRGIDQIQSHSAPPELYEPWVRDARRYVALAETASGPIPRRVAPDYVWGEALAELERRRPVARIINLETSLTAAGEPWPGKVIHYRTHPANVTVLTAAGIDVAVLANNHVLDWGRDGLAETLTALHHAGVHTAGAGRNLAAAQTPAVVAKTEQVRLLVFACGAASSGLPEEWAATAGRNGVWRLDELTEEAADAVAAVVQRAKRPGDLALVSIHWGGNWGYAVPAAQRRFAHRLIERGGVDLIHGHSSHHAKGIEVHRGRLILYGCGDLLTDYEGIAGHESFRGDLGLLYFPRLAVADGRLVDLKMVPLQTRRFRLQHAAREDAAWLRDTLSREGEALGTTVELAEDDSLTLRWRC